MSQKFVDAGAGGVGVGGSSLDHEVGGRRNPVRLGSIATLGPREGGGKRVAGAPTHPDAAEDTLANVGLTTRD
jgi:hypothetical protein